MRGGWDSVGVPILSASMHETFPAVASGGVGVIPDGKEQPAIECDLVGGSRPLGDYVGCGSRGRNGGLHLVVVGLLLLDFETRGG